MVSLTFKLKYYIIYRAKLKSFLYKCPKTHLIKQKGKNMKKYKDSKEFGLKAGETLIHKGKYIQVFDRKNGIRIYCLNGKYLGYHFFKNGYSSMEMNEFCMPLAECILIKDTFVWELYSYEGEKICNQRITKIDFPSKASEYIFIYNGLKQMAIYSKVGKCILDFCNCGELVFAKKNIFIFKNNISEYDIFDAKAKKFMQNSFEEVIPTIGGFYLKNSEGYHFLNEETAKIEIQVDAFYSIAYYKIPHTRNYIYFDVIYKNKCCGVLAKLQFCDSTRKNLVKVIIPIEFKKIEVCEDKIKAYEEDGITTYSCPMIYSKYFGQEDSEYKESFTKIEENTEIKLFFQTVKSGEIVYMYDKIFAIKGLKNEIISCSFFSMNGTYLGKAGLFDDGENSVRPNIVETESWVALGIDSSGGTFNANYGNWILRSYDGQKVMNIPFDDYEKRNNYYIFSYNMKIRRFSDKALKSYVAIFDQKGKLILTLNDVDAVVCEKSCFKVIDSNGKISFYNLSGKIIVKDLDENRVENIEDTIWVKSEKNPSEGCIMYNCLTGDKYQLYDERIEKVTDIYINELKLYKVYRQNYCGIFKFTGDFSLKSDCIPGFKKVVPIKYIEIDTTSENSAIFVQFRAIRKECEEIYDIDGNVIATTES